ncbi:MAG: tetratricopeptide repeat protein [Myxococcota bacterium]
MIDVFKPTKKKAEDILRKAMRSGDLGPAISYYMKYVDAKPRDHEAQNDLGWMLLQEGRPEDALERFEKANDLEEDAAHYNNKGRALLELERFPEASEAFRHAAELDPEDEEAPFNMAVAMRAQDRHEDALDALDALLEAHDDFAPAHVEYAMCLQELDRDEDAIAHFETALELDPSWVPARISTVQALCDLARYPAATEHLEFIDELGAEVVVELGGDDLTIAINDQIIYEGAFDDSVPGFGE